MRDTLIIYSPNRGRLGLPLETPLLNGSAENYQPSDLALILTEEGFLLFTTIKTQ